MFSLLVAAHALALFCLAHASPPYARSSCRNIPGDAGWPSVDTWNKLNASIGGRLIATVPLAALCHEPHYDEQKCSALHEQWMYAPIHVESPSSVMWPPLYNGTCTPFGARDEACTLGNLVAYSINASSAADIAAGMRFAEAHNIRLVIKNTGHDLLGKSTGIGALGIWTHNLNATTAILNYSSPAYSGAALKMGAGVQAHAAYAAAHRYGHRVVGGVCPTVGIAGGYSLGGGTSTLTPQHGLGADNVLEWEVVTANGTHTVAAPHQNPDLYWALSGGGGGTYAVVVSMTARMHRDDAPTIGAQLVFNASSAPSSEAYWTAVDVALGGDDLAAPLVDAGAFMFLLLTNSTAVLTLTAPPTAERPVRGHLRRLVGALDRLRIAYALDDTVHGSYYEHFDHYYGPLPYGAIPATDLVTTRLVPRSFVQSQARRAKNTTITPTAAAGDPAEARSLSPLASFYRLVTADPGMRAAHLALTAPARARVAPNAVHPAWRTALAVPTVYVPWDWRASAAATMRARQARLDRVVEPALRALLPHSPPYLNEVNAGAPQGVRESYGANWARLHRVKRAYDPRDVFYAPYAVGSAAWVPDAAGRLCRAS